MVPSRTPLELGGRGLFKRPKAVLLAALTVLLGCTALGTATADSAPENVADTVLVNGRVLLYPDATTPENYMSSEIDWAEAVAVEGDEISYVGDSDGARELVGPDTELVDVGGKMVMPGIGDGHLHGATPPQCTLDYEGGTVEQVLTKIKDCLLRDDQAEHLDSNFRLTVSNFMGEGMLPSGTRLDRHILDRLSADPADDEFGTGTTRPIVVRHMDGHKSYTNTKAIENAGLDETTPDPTDGFIGRDEDGYPNGQFADFSANWGPSLPAAPDATYNGRVANIEFANSLGITAILRPSGGLSDLQIAKRLADEGELTVHFNQAQTANGVRGEDDPAALQALINDLNTRRAEYDGYSNPASPGELAVDTVKVFCDGVPEFPGQTAAMLEPYRINEGTDEEPHWVHGEWRGEEPSCEDARLGYIALDRAHWTIHSHSLGDRATRVVVQNHAAAMDENATWDSRHTLTHLQFVDARDIPRFGELGLVASMSQQWNQRDGWSVDGIEGYIAPERQDNMYPTKDLIDGGAIVAQGSDWPVTDLLPWAAIEQAVTREGQVNPARAIYPGAQNIGDAITYEQALKTSTIGVAYQMHRDDVSGSIEVGKVADLVVLDSDPYDPSGGELAKLDQAEAELAAANDAEAAAEQILAAAEDELARVQPSLKPAKASLKKATKRAKKAKAKDKKAKAKLKRAKARGNAKQVKRAKAKRQRTRKRAKATAKKAKAERRKLRNRRAAVVAAREAVATGKQELEAARAARELAERSLADRQADYESAFEEAVKQVSETKVLRTMVAGKTVYQAEG